MEENILVKKNKKKAKKKINFEVILTPIYNFYDIFFKTIETFWSNAHDGINDIRKTQKNETLKEFYTGIAYFFWLIISTILFIIAIPLFFLCLTFVLLLDIIVVLTFGTTFGFLPFLIDTEGIIPVKINDDLENKEEKSKIPVLLTPATWSWLLSRKIFRILTYDYMLLPIRKLIFLLKKDKKKIVEIQILAVATPISSILYGIIVAILLVVSMALVTIPLALIGIILHGFKMAIMSVIRAFRNNEIDKEDREEKDI